MWQLRCIATWGGPTPSQWDARVKFEVGQPISCYIYIYNSVLTADTLHYAVTFDPVTLTFNLWPWAFLVYRLWRDETLYQNMSYEVISIWTFDLMT